MITFCFKIPFNFLKNKEKEKVSSITLSYLCCISRHGERNHFKVCSLPGLHTQPLHPTRKRFHPRVPWVQRGSREAYINRSPGKTASQRIPEGHPAPPWVSPTKTRQRSHHVFSALFSALSAAASFVSSWKPGRSNVTRPRREPGGRCWLRTPL